MQKRRFIGILLCWMLGTFGAWAWPPPTLGVQPVNTTVHKRDTASFSVSANGNGTPLSYQWYFGTKAITGATTDSLALSNCTSNNAGQYHVAVSNAGGTVNSTNATLTVIYSPPVDNNDAYTLGENGVLTVGAPGMLANDTDPNGDTMVVQVVSGVSHGTLNLSTNGGFSYTPEGNFTGTDSFVYRSRDSDGLVGNNATVTVTVVPPPSISGLGVTNITLTSAQLTGTVDGQGGATSCYFQYGVTANYGATTPVVSGVSSTVSPASAALSGLIDGTVYHYCLVASNVAGVTVSPDASFTTSVGSPDSSTLTVASITSTGAVLKAQVTQQAVSLTCYFQYGETTNYGSVSASTVVPILGGLLGGGGLFGVATPISGLVPGRIYHYRLVTSGLGTTYGPDASFQTTSLPALRLSGGMSSSPVSSTGKMGLSLTNTPGLSFTVWCSSNLVSWTAIGKMTEVSSGHYQFTDSAPATNRACWYRISSP